MLKNIKNSKNLKGGENMELKVKEGFKDKYTGEIYPAGKILKVSKERAEELLKSAYVVVETAKPKTKNSEKSDTADTDKDE